MGNYEEAVRAALGGPELKGIKLSEHEYNVKPVERIQEGNKILLKGQISHCLAGQRDDQVHYVMTIAPGSVVKIERYIDETSTIKTLFQLAYVGGSIVVTVFVPPLGAALLGATGQTTQAVELVRQNVVGNDWRSVCDSLIALIGIAAADDLSVLNEPPPPTGFTLVRRYWKNDERDWVSVGAETTDLQMLLWGYLERKKQFLAPISPSADTIGVFRWRHPIDHDWLTIPDGSINDGKLKDWGYRDKTFSFYAYKSNAPDRVAVNRWWHEGDRDWVTIVEGEISDDKLKSWSYTNKTMMFYGKKLSEV